MSLFSSLNIARTALQADEQALAVTGHNIANAGTPGYTRQTAALAALPLAGTGPVAGGASALGGGVAVTDIQRVRDQFADSEYRSDVATQSQDQAVSDAMDQVQALLAEPSDQGLQSAMSRFFQSFADLANAPENPAVRATVVQSATAMAGSIQRLWQGLGNIITAADSKIVARVAEVNTAAAQVATLNAQIARATAARVSAADLMDQRDQLLDRLAALTGAQIVTQSDGSANVVLGGRLLAGPAGAAPISVVAGAGGLATFKWSDGNPVTIAGGEIGGLLTVRDQMVPGWKGQLSTLTGALVSQVNAAHAAGFGLSGSTGVNFFDPASTPATIQVNPAVVANTSLIAASKSGAPGDGSNALAISRLFQQPTIGAYYQGWVTGLGVQAQQVQRNVQADGMLVRQADALRQSAGGVSLDEEAANMVRFQRSYQAAARFAATVDDLLDTLINRI